jgi:hypothetical protein
MANFREPFEVFCSYALSIAEAMDVVGGTRQEQGRQASYFGNSINTGPTLGLRSGLYFLVFEPQTA